MAANSLVHALPGWAQREKLTPAQANALQVQAAQSINRTQTTSGWGAVPLMLRGEYSNPTHKRIIYATSGKLYFTTSTGTIVGYVEYGLDLRPFRGHLLTGARLHLTPKAGHGGAPGTLPNIALYKTRVGTGVVSSLGTAVYVWGGGGAEPATYEAGFYLTISGLTEAIDTENFEYHVMFEPESGANYVDDGTLDGLQLNITPDTSYGGTDFRFWP